MAQTVFLHTHTPPHNSHEQFRVNILANCESFVTILLGLCADFNNNTNNVCPLFLF